MGALADVGGVHDPEILSAAILHDTVEDTQTTPAELEQRFGARVRSLAEGAPVLRRVSLRPRVDRQAGG